MLTDDGLYNKYRSEKVRLEKVQMADERLFLNMANERRNRSSSSTTLTRNNLQTTTPANLSQFSFKNGTRATSLKTSETDLTHVDPDSLFVKHTISEIKAIQAKLKSVFEFFC